MQGTTAPSAAPDMTFPRPHGVLAAESERYTLLVMPTPEEAAEMTAVVARGGGTAAMVPFGDLGVAALRQIADYERDRYHHAVGIARRRLHYRRWQAARMVLRARGDDA